MPTPRLHEDAELEVALTVEYVPPQLAKVLLFVEQEVRDGRSFPSSRAIRDYMGWLHDRASCDALMSLAAKGYVRIKARMPSGRGFRYEWELTNQHAQHSPRAL